MIMHVTKEEAGELLYKSIAESKGLPVYDKVISRVINSNSIEEYTFRYLIKYAYSLEEDN